MCVTAEPLTWRDMRYLLLATGVFARIDEDTQANGVVFDRMVNDQEH